MIPQLLASAALAEDTPLLYQPPAHTASTVSLGVDVGARPSGALRFVDPVAGRAGYVQSLSGSWAATPWFGAGVDGFLSLGNPEDAPVSAAAGGWVRAVRPPSDGVGVGAQLGAHREFGGVWAITGELLVDVPIGPVNVALAPMLERRLDPDADSVDILVPIAAGVSVAEDWRVGAEVLGQDLEDYFEEEEEEAEGGAVWLAAASAGWHSDRVEIGLAPGVSVGPGGVGFAGRLRAGWRF